MISPARTAWRPSLPRRHQDDDRQHRAARKKSSQGGAERRTGHPLIDEGHRWSTHRRGRAHEPGEHAGDGQRPAAGSDPHAGQAGADCDQDHQRGEHGEAVGGQIGECKRGQQGARYAPEHRPAEPAHTADRAFVPGHQNAQRDTGHGGRARHETRVDQQQEGRGHERQPESDRALHHRSEAHGQGGQHERGRTHHAITPTFVNRPPPAAPCTSPRTPPAPSAQNFWVLLRASVLTNTAQNFWVGLSRAQKFWVVLCAYGRTTPPKLLGWRASAPRNFLGAALAGPSRRRAGGRRYHRETRSVSQRRLP